MNLTFIIIDLVIFGFSLFVGTIAGVIWTETHNNTCENIAKITTIIAIVCTIITTILAFVFGLAPVFEELPNLERTY